MAQSRQEMPTEDIVALEVSLVNFALKCYPSNTDYADRVFGTIEEIFGRLNIAQ